MRQVLSSTKSVTPLVLLSILLFISFLSGCRSMWQLSNKLIPQLREWAPSPRLKEDPSDGSGEERWWCWWGWPTENGKTDRKPSGEGECEGEGHR